MLPPAFDSHYAALDALWCKCEMEGGCGTDFQALPVGFPHYLRRCERPIKTIAALSLRHC